MMRFRSADDDICWSRAPHFRNVIPLIGIRSGELPDYVRNSQLSTPVLSELHSLKIEAVKLNLNCQLCLKSNLESDID